MKEDRQLTEQEQFAVDFHEWCMTIGFTGFHKATYAEKFNEFRKYTKTKLLTPKGDQPNK